MRTKMVILFFALSLVPVIALAQPAINNAGDPCSSQATGSGLCDPIQIGAIGDVNSFVRYAIQFVLRWLSFIAIATIVYAGIKFMSANGNDKVISEAKSTITYAVIGFVLSVLAYAGVAAIENFFGVQSTKPGESNTIFNPFGKLTLDVFVKQILQNVLGISGLVALAMLIWNGFRYMTARGHDKQVATAKSGILWSLVGLAIILFAYVIISSVAHLIS